MPQIIPFMDGIINMIKVCLLTKVLCQGREGIEYKLEL